MSRESGHLLSRLDRLYSPPEIGGPGKRRARAERRDLLLAGGFVLVMAVVALLTLTFLTPGLFGRAYRLNVYFPDAEGLDVGVQVVQSGYVMGLVEQVTPLFPGRDPEADACGASPPASARRHVAPPCFRATLRIQRDWTVPRDSLAQLRSAGLLKGDVVEILPGASPEPLAAGEHIQALGRRADLVERLGTLTETIKSLVDETIAPTLVSLRDQIKAIETLIGAASGQGEGPDRLAGAFENLRVLSARLRDAVDPEAIADILRSVKSLSNDLARMTAELRGSTGDIERAVTRYGDLALDLRGLVEQNRPALQQSLDDTRYLLQTLSAALTPILTNIEDATRNLSALSRELRQDPTTLLKRHAVEERTPWFQE